MTQAVQLLPVDALLPAPRNPKLHAEGEIRESMGRFGYVEPIVVDERTGRIVAGHGRREALLAMRAEGKNPPTGVQVGQDGRWYVPVLRGWASRDDVEAEAYLLASNQLTARGGWDADRLDAILADLSRVGDAAVRGTGFDRKVVERSVERLKVQAAAVAPEMLAGAPPSRTEIPALTFAVTIDCDSEQEQLELLRDLQARGLRCRALML